MNFIKTYDKQLQSKLNHLKLHSAYLPHIGLKYNEARAKVIIIEEIMQQAEGQYSDWSA
ncbi:hypothetical protein [Winogradskyella psychrotolerans]|uniref:hypothetical protein n=1 Tax=Winogradskyella psychrotolerans TaxID=1344585 RepID=UPI001C07A59F|nr:hypothetical protein [Winogradskyella psychrotolerans]MBU2929441.1 hypothetical protein [Winogradskyella psychrotolerans]